MSEATAEALAPEVTDAPEAEPTESEAMEAAWAKLQEPETAEEAPEPANEPDESETAEEEPEEALEEAAEPVESAPTDLPSAVRAKWSEIPEEAREAIRSSHQEMGRKLAEQGRLVQGISPIRDALVSAAKDMPNLANMKPEQVAEEVLGLAKISNDFAAKPLETMVSLIRQHNLEEPLRKVFAGQTPQQSDMTANAMMQHIQRLERQLQQATDPEFMRSQFEQLHTQTSTEREVSEFAQQAEHWAEVENYLPQMLPAVQAMHPNASVKDTLQRAYDLAVSQIVPNAKATATEEPPAPDPETVKAAERAKSVNIKSTSSGKRRAMTEQEIMERTWARMQNQ